MGSASRIGTAKRLLTRKVHNEEVDDELCDLHSCQVLLPLCQKSGISALRERIGHIPKSWHHPQLHSSSSLAI